MTQSSHHRERDRSQFGGSQIDPHCTTRRVKSIACFLGLVRVPSGLWFHGFIARKLMLNRLTVVCSLTFLLLAFAPSAQAEASQDGREHPLQDSFLDGLAGDWQAIRVMKNRTVENIVHGEWVLNHQFLRLHYRDVASPSKYEA